MWKLNKQPRAATTADVAKQRLGLKPSAPAVSRFEVAKARATALFARAKAWVMPAGETSANAREHLSVASSAKYGPNVTASLLRKGKKMAVSK